MSHSAPRLTIRLLGAPEMQVAGLPLVLNHLNSVLPWGGGLGQRPGRRRTCHFGIGFSLSESNSLLERTRCE